MGRVVVAAVHEALATQLPLRLEFYESYLRPMGMRAGRIGAASFTAALSFLRREPDAYGPVVRQAGALAARWTYDGEQGLRRALWERLPDGARRRRALKLMSKLVDGTLRGARGRLDGPRRARRLVITGSPFCNLRQPVTSPMCGFYVAALEQFLALLEVPSGVEIAACHAMGHEACQYALVPRAVVPAEDQSRAERMLT
jgi:predicted hydrocarbon binding protein